MNRFIIVLVSYLYYFFLYIAVKDLIGAGGLKAKESLNIFEIQPELIPIKIKIKGE